MPRSAKDTCFGGPVRLKTHAPPTSCGKDTCAGRLKTHASAIPPDERHMLGSTEDTCSCERHMLHQGHMLRSAKDACSGRGRMSRDTCSDRRKTHAPGSPCSERHMLRRLRLGKTHAPITGDTCSGHSTDERHMLGSAEDTCFGDPDRLKTHALPAPAGRRHLLAAGSGSTKNTCRSKPGGRQTGGNAIRTVIPVEKHRAERHRSRKTQGRMAVTGLKTQGPVAPTGWRHMFRIGQRHLLRRFRVEKDTCSGWPGTTARPTPVG